MGLPAGCGVVSTRVARSSLPGSTGLGRGCSLPGSAGLEVVKLVEPILTSVSEWVVSKPPCACLGT